MKILVLPGDGIGPEITESTVAILDAVNKRFGLGIEYVYEDIGFVSLDKYGTTLRAEVLDMARTVDGILLGPISHLDYPPRDKGGVNVSSAFRGGLDLYSNVRPARTRPGLGRGAEGMDLVIMRECTEGFYPDRNMHSGSSEFMPVPGVVLSMRKLTERCCERIARRSFEMAMKRRRKVTAIHKANNFIMSDGMFLDVTRTVAAEFPDAELDELIIDAAAAWLVREPSRFDVICATNFYGDILSDLASELSGSLGLAGSINIGDDLAAAQAQHGSAPDIAGQDKANPTSLILSAAMLLDWMGDKHDDEKLRQAAGLMQTSIDATLADPQTRTSDLGGNLGTSEFTKAVAEKI
jgi:3-isopropylmalate dehydrogenase